MTTPTEPFAEHPDAELLRRVHAGQADAFTALYRRHQGPLYRFALLRCGSGDTAADIVQDAFLGLMSGRFAYDPLRGPLQHFLFGVARNLARKSDEAHRRHGRLPDTGDDGAPDADAIDAAASEAVGPLGRLLDNETAEQVRRALSLLPPHYRDPVILYELHELSYQEIAAVCQVDIGTVRSRLSRGRAALARRLHGLQGRHAAPSSGTRAA